MKIKYIIILSILLFFIIAIIFFFLGPKLFPWQGPYELPPSDTIEVASESCVYRCVFAQNSEEITLKNSGYCKKWYKFDNDEDGNIDKDIEGNVRKYHCYESPISISCPGVEQFCEKIQ